MGSWIIIVDTRSGSLPSYHLIMSNTDRPDKLGCWLLTMLQPNESQHGMLLKGLQRDANLCTGASCTWARAWQRCSYDTVIPSTYSAVLHRPGRTAEIRLAMDLTVFDVALRSLGHPKGPQIWTWGSQRAMATLNALIWKKFIYSDLSRSTKITA